MRRSLSNDRNVASPCRPRPGQRVAVAIAFLLGSTALLVGCGAPPPSERPLGPQLPPPPEMVKIERRCDATQARFALGQAMNGQMLEQTRDRTGADQAITVGPGESMPTPTDPLRLILEVDAQGKMVAARCG